MAKKKSEKLSDAELEGVRGGTIDAGATFKLQNANIDAQHAALGDHEATHIVQGDGEKTTRDVVLKGSKIKQN